MLKQAFVIFTLLWASSMLSGQTLPARENTLSAQERAQGWQLLFDGR